MDPLTLFALANGAVSAVKAGCKLYKDIKSAAGDVKGVLDDLDQQFKKKFPPENPPTVAEKNQYIEEKNRVVELNKKSGDTFNIYTEIGQQLGVYYDNYYKCLAVFEEEERRSKTEVYHGEDSLGKRALQRVLLKKQLEAMSTELREIMVYNSPPELGALWTEVEAMMKKVGKEQSGAVALQMRAQAEANRQSRRRRRKMQYRVMCWSLVLVVLMYVWWLSWAVLQVRIENRPELGVCVIPKGTWPYEHYNRLKWIECDK